ncbi:hypothetical protein EON63_09945 [archaeon]|nr:MAG: hypothetical protein EON63_09945 [archaeon]
MGIHIFSNASHGGDYILQPILHNAPWLTTLLPSNPPLSTMRVITTSTYTLSEEYMQHKERSLYSSIHNEMMRDDEGDGYCASVSVGMGGNGEGYEVGMGAGAVGMESNGVVGRVPGSTTEKSTSFAARNITTDPHLTYNMGRVAGMGDGNDDGDGDGDKCNRLGGGEHSDGVQAIHKYIEGRCAVLRLGREGAKTDHSSVLFDVDMQTG